VNFFYDDIFNHFYAVRPECYRFRWNNAKQGPLRRSRSFMVTDFGTKRKLTYDVLLVIIILTYLLSRTVSEIQPSIGSKIAVFGYPVLRLAAPTKGFPISISYYCYQWYVDKTRFLGYISVAGSLSASSTAFMQCAPEATELRRSRSFNVTDFGTNRKLIYDFLLVINTNLPPILHLFRDIAFDRSKIAAPLAFKYPDLRVPLGRSP